VKKAGYKRGVIINVSGCWIFEYGFISGPDYDENENNK
jgi:hypothetical protein